MKKDKQIKTVDYQVLFQNAPDMLFLLDEDLHVLFVNETASAALGLDKGEIMGSDFLSLVYSADQDLIRSIVHPVDEKNNNHEFRLVHGNGSFFRVCGTSSRTVAGGEGSLLVACRGMDDYWDLGNTIEEGVRRFPNVFEYSPDAIFIEDINRRILDVNPAACRLHGMTRDELIGMDAADLVPPEYRDLVADDFTLLAKDKVEHIENFSIGPDGSPIPVEIRMSRILYNNRQALLLHVREVRQKREAEEQIRALARFPNENPNPVLRLLNDGTLIYANEAALLLLEEWQCSVNDKAPVHVIRHVYDACEKKKSIEREIMCGDRVCSLVFTPVEGEDYVNIYGLDITEQKKSREVQQRLISLIESSNEFIGLTDMKGRVLYLNEAGMNLCGVDTINGDKSLTIENFVPEEGKAYLRDILMSSLLKDGHFKTRKYIRHLKTGERIDVEINVFLINDGGGNPTHIAVVINDIRDRIRREREIRETEERFRRLVGTAPIGILLADSTANILVVNDACAQIFGYSVQQMKENNFLDLIPEDSRELALDIREKLNSGSDMRNREFLITKQDGGNVPVEVSVSTIRDEKEKVTNYIALIRDISQRNELQRQLNQSQKMEAVGLLAGGVAHDFNNILSVIIGYSDFILTKLDDDDTLSPFVQEIRKAGNRAASLTHQLLAFSRRQMLRSRVLDLNVLVSDMEKMLQRLIGEDVELITNLDGSVSKLKADHGQIEQIVMNLAVNARDAMPEGGILTIKTENRTVDEEHCRVVPDASTGVFVLLSLSDTGFGMADDVSAHIFEPFFTTKREGGTGLGLSVTYGIAKQHGGWIEVRSTPGKGSTFEVYLPALLHEEAEEVVIDIPDDTVRGKGERILVVEDEDMLRTFAQGALSDKGYSVLTASSYSQGIDLFRKEEGRFDLVFSDVVLPDKTGLDLVNECRSIKPSVKVLLTSGYLDQKSQWNEIRNRGYRFMEKPYSLVEMFSTIDDLLRNQV